MPPIERIATLRGPLTIECAVCGHKVVWSEKDAMARLGGECMVTDARRRLFCSACGERSTTAVNFRS